MEMLGCNIEMNIFIVLFTPIVALIIFLFSTKFAHGNGKKTLKRPPGDMGWPIIGSTFLFFKPHPPTDPGDFVNQQLSKHGKIFTTRILGKTTIISADPDLNKFLLQNELRLINNKLPSQIRKLLGVNNLAYLTGDKYKHDKSVAIRALSSWEIQTRFLDDVQKAAECVFNTWRHNDVLYINDEAQKYTFNIIAGTTLGMNAGDPEAEQLRRYYATFHGGFYALPVNLPCTRYWKALRARESIIKIVKKRVECKKMEDRSNRKPRDLIESFLDSDSHESVENICDSVIAGLFGGLVNPATCISLAIYFLGNCPKAVEKMRDEHQQILREKKDGKTNLVWDDYKKMKFSQYVISETLRMGNIVPILWKKAIQDIDFKGYLIPEGTAVVIHTAAMHMDPTAYERPEDFNPWRWESMKNMNSWMPFGRGVRHCNASEHVKIEVAIFLHYFLLNYNWEPAEPDHPIYWPPITFQKGLPIKVYPLNNRI